ncbi:MAG TPA: DUF1684 domain-containing protein [Bacteroidia bacterium]
MASRIVHYSFAVLSILLVACSGNDKGKSADNYVLNLINERSEKDKHVIKDGIIEEDLLEKFKGLQYFDVDSSFKLKATIIQCPLNKVEFKTTTERAPVYYTICKLRFKIKGVECELMAYAEDSLGQSGLFIPFKDLTSNKSSYGGGRYLDVKYNGEKESLTLDFNRAYNPYCHYNHSYSCPLVPIENTLKVAIEAGEKKLYE